MKIDELFERAWKNHWDKPRFHKSGWAREVHRLYEVNLKPIFGDCQVTRLRAKKIRHWHRSLEETPVTANRALEVLSRLFRFAEEEELVPQGQNPCTLVSSHPEKKRKRYATADEITQIGVILNREEKEHPKAVLFIRLLMMTGARPRALERATWGELSFVGQGMDQSGVLLYQGKTSAGSGEEEMVVFPPQALKLLQWHVKHSPSELLIGIKMPKAFWSKVRQEAGCPDLWMRDWRRTFATTALSAGIGVGVISELLNHRSTQTTKVYAHLLQEERLRAAGLIAAKFIKAAS